MKKFISLIISIMLFTTIMLTVSAYSDSKFVNGDVDLDEKENHRLKFI